MHGLGLNTTCSGGKKTASLFGTIGKIYIFVWISLVAQTVKDTPAMQETWVQSLGWEDSQEEGMATHSSILAWKIPMDRGAWRAIVPGIAKSQTRLSIYIK